MAKKKKNKKKDKKIAAKVKGIKKEKALKAKVKAKSKKEKVKVKKDKTKIKKSGTSSLMVTALTAISNIKKLRTAEAVKNYTKGDKRVTVIKAAKSRNNSLLPE